MARRIDKASGHDKEIKQKRHDHGGTMRCVEGVPPDIYTFEILL